MTTEITEVQSTTAPTTPPEEDTITVNDLYNYMQIMDFAASQGAFKGWETMVQVLNSRTKLYKFLSKNMPNFEDVISGKAAQAQAEAEAPKKAKAKGRK